MEQQWKRVAAGVLLHKRAWGRVCRPRIKEGGSKLPGKGKGGKKNKDPEGLSFMEVSGGGGGTRQYRENRTEEISTERPERGFGGKGNCPAWV